MEKQFLLTPSVEEAFVALLKEKTNSYLEAGKKTFNLFLSGGPTAKRCYLKLAEVGFSKEEKDLVNIFMTDERVVDPNDDDSNAKMIYESLIKPLGLEPKFHPMDASDINSYESLLSNLDSFDFMHLGLGPDGHTASLFANSDALIEQHNLVAYNEDPNGKNPHKRVTLTLNAINKAKLLVFTVSGIEKHDAFEKVKSNANIPANLIKGEEIIFIVDEKAYHG